MNSEEALYLLMANQKKVRDDFKFVDLNTHEKVSIEECYGIVMKDLERLETYDKTKKIYGIDLITLSKATQECIWVKRKNVLYFFDNLIIDLKLLEVLKKYIYSHEGDNLLHHLKYDKVVEDDNS